MSKKLKEKLPQMEIKKDFAFGINVEEMAERGVHLGHSLSSLHPKMRPFIYGMKNGIYVIDLEKTGEKLEELLRRMKELKDEGKQILFVGTKYQIRDLVKEIAESLNFPYVISRWIGGTFTNFSEIRKRVDYMLELEKGLASGKFDSYTKLERQKLNQELEKLKEKFEGIREMKELPSAVFLTNLDKDITAAIEAKKLSIEVLAIADTNVDCTLADYFIPANDDSISSVEYILRKVEEVLKGELE